MEGFFKVLIIGGFECFGQYLVAPSSKERIAFGLIAQNQSLSALQFSKILDLRGANPTRGWLDRMTNNNLILSQGKTRGTEYYINPEIIRSVNFNKTPSLKTIEPHRLRELIFEDLKMYPNSSISVAGRCKARISHAARAFSLPPRRRGPCKAVDYQ